jgi:hypothetical protein
VLQVVEANENFRMLLCHDGIHTVVIHVTPKAMDAYRAGIQQDDSLSGNNNSIEMNSEDQLQQPQAPTLNKLAANQCLIQIKDWHWSTTIICSAWLRGMARPISRELANKSQPYCIQVGKLTHVGVNLPHNLYSSKNMQNSIPSTNILFHYYTSLLYTLYFVSSTLFLFHVFSINRSGTSRRE